MNHVELFHVQDLSKMHGLIREHALGTLIVQLNGQLYLDHLPFMLDTSGMCKLGRLSTHAAGDNPFWSSLPDAISCTVAFHGPNSYISPSWYPSRRLHGRVQPSWYYCVVHARGVLRVLRDPQALGASIRKMTDYFENARVEAWQVDEAPAKFVNALVGQIVGLEIEVSDLVGKWQVGQQRNQADREGIVTALQNAQTTAERRLATHMLEAVQRPRLPQSDETTT